MCLDKETRLQIAVFLFFMPLVSKEQGASYGLTVPTNHQDTTKAPKKQDKTQSFDVRFGRAGREEQRTGSIAPPQSLVYVTEA